MSAPTLSLLGGASQGASPHRLPPSFPESLSLMLGPSSLTSDLPSAPPHQSRASFWARSSRAEEPCEREKPPGSPNR